MGYIYIYIYKRKVKRDNEGEDLEFDMFRLKHYETWIRNCCRIRFERDNHKLVECEYCDKH